MRSITTWTFKPDDPLLLASRFQNEEGTMLLYSGGDLDSAENSYLCLFPDEKISLKAHKGVWEELKHKIGPLDEKASLPKWVGFLSYEMGHFADKDAVVPSFSSSCIDALFYRPTVIVHFNHKTKEAALFAKKEVSLEGSFLQESSFPLELTYRSDTLDCYQKKIQKIKELILDGIVYQVNLSQEFHLSGKTAPFSYFRTVSELNPAPFSAYLNCGSFSLVSSSPERFLKKTKDLLETRPIKGTKSRGKTLQEDAKNREELLSSPKERAELLMITDLLRNDLGKISLPGSVTVKKIWHTESYENVFHLLSIIHSRVLKEMHVIEILKALFPGGSITGCPKLMAMKAISELEKRPRGIYTGCMGYLAANGDCDFNIAIRTLFVEEAKVTIQLGGGIVIDSDPIQEYEETLHKGRSLFRTLKVSNQFE